jgi:RecG-like helicase
VIRSLDASTDRIVDFFGDPRSTAPFLRRGLVMGDVQSGKTANYIGLCCKAADAGYRLIILLTGTIEHLRKQTQDRLDKGFVGFETRTASVRQAAPRKHHGVGMIDAQPQVQVLTTTESDFSIQLATQVWLA